MYLYVYTYKCKCMYIMYIYIYIYKNNDFTNHSSKSLTYIHDLYYDFYISCVLATCLLWCAMRSSTPRFHKCLV